MKNFLCFSSLIYLLIGCVSVDDVFYVQEGFTVAQEKAIEKAFTDWKNAGHNRQVNLVFGDYGNCGLERQCVYAVDSEELANHLKHNGERMHRHCNFNPKTSLGVARSDCLEDDCVDHIWLKSNSTRDEFRWVTLHEVGHVLGGPRQGNYACELGSCRHSNDKKNVMHPSTIVLDLTREDLEFVCNNPGNIWGCNEEFFPKE